MQNVQELPSHSSRIAFGAGANAYSFGLVRIGSILLAAGGSTRLGSAKQLLHYEGQSLLRRAATTVQEVGCHPLVVVLGARAVEARGELDGLNIEIAENTAWDRGMGSSLRLGLETLLRAEDAPDLDGILLTLCDQPLVGRGQLQTLLDAFGPSHPLVAAAYGETVGVPAVFGRQYFAELLALPDGAGAKSLLTAHRQSLTRVSLPQAATDIDTREQYAKLTASNPSETDNSPKSR